MKKCFRVQRKLPVVFKISPPPAKVSYMDWKIISATTTLEKKKLVQLKRKKFNVHGRTFINRIVKQSKHKGIQNSNNQENPWNCGQEYKENDDISLAVQHKHLKQFLTKQSLSMISVPVSMFNNMKKS